MSGDRAGTGTLDKVGLLFAAAGAAMVVGFFLAWADLGDFGSISGFDLARGDGWRNHLLWIAPACGAGLVALGTRDPRRARSLGILTGLVVLGWTAYAMAGDLWHGLSWGGWIALGGAALMIASGAARQRGLGLAAGAIAAIAFFLPWWGEWSGFDLARGGGVVEWTARLAPVWLALGGAVLGAIGGLGEHRGPRVAMIAGVAIVVGVAWPYLAVVHLVFGLGAWLTLGGAAAALGLGVATKRA